MTAVAALPRAMFGAGFNPVRQRMQPLKYAFLRDLESFQAITFAIADERSDFFGKFHTRNCANCPNQGRTNLELVIKLDLGHAPVITDR